ncbi:MAG: hypothetical protein ACJATI_004604 [Halioglobus sp.]|jgi:hypothetical protein
MEIQKQLIMACKSHIGVACADQNVIKRHAQRINILNGYLRQNISLLEEMYMKILVQVCL